MRVGIAQRLHKYTQFGHPNNMKLDDSSTMDNTQKERERERTIQLPNSYSHEDLCTMALKKSGPDTDTLSCNHARPYCTNRQSKQWYARLDN